MKAKIVAVTKLDPKCPPCPECTLPMGGSSASRPYLAVCQCCAAIGVWDSAKGRYRQPRTEEWTALAYKPEHHDFMDTRYAVLDRITQP